ncbi:RNA polymerase sigma factor [Patescibacteria group bacterium]|nr:RNA polymerase sigma factor [Patescibacteria group bacterium]
MPEEISCKNKTDEDLVTLTLKNQDFYVCIMERYEGKLLRYVMRISRVSVEDGEDILQEVFIKVYQNLNGFDVKKSFSSWIYRIARNETISQARKRKVRPEVTYSVDDEVIAKKMIAEADVQKEVDQRIQSKEVRDIIESLSKKYRDVLVLRYLEDKSYEEIADILKKPPGTVATLLNRAKKVFKKKAKQLVKHHE